MVPSARRSRRAGTRRPTQRCNFAEGRLSGRRLGGPYVGIHGLQAELGDNPTGTARRAFLFELLCFAGEYDRAEKQLNVLGDTNNQALAGTLLYRSALHAEKTR